MKSELIDSVVDIGKRIGGFSGRVKDMNRLSEVEKIIRNSLYPIRNAQNASSLLKALSEVQQDIEKISQRGILFRSYIKRDLIQNDEITSQEGKSEHLWIDTEILSYLATSDCEWEKVKNLIVIAATNILSRNNNNSIKELENV